MFRQAFTRVLRFLGMAKPVPVPRPAEGIPMPSFVYPERPRRRQPHRRRGPGWYRACERRAVESRAIRDAHNAQAALYWRKRVLEANPCADPGAFMPKVRWVKGGNTRVGGKYD